MRPLRAIEPAQLFAFIWRDRYILLTILFIFALVSICYLKFATPVYTAETAILIDTKRDKILDDKVGAESLSFPAEFASQIQIILSESVALNVIKSLKLTSDDDFIGDMRSLQDKTLRRNVKSIADRPVIEVEREAVSRLRNILRVERVPDTFVIIIKVSYEDPAKAAQIANAVADAYMIGELDAKFEATRRVNVWIQEQTEDLQTRAMNADRAVQDFKRENNIVGTGQGLVSDEQVGQTNAQLTQARSATAEAFARFELVRQYIGSDITDGALPAEINNELMTRLRSQLADLSAREADLSRRFGTDHPAVATLRQQTSEIKQSIDSEIRRLGQSYDGEYRIALAREQGTERNLRSLIEASSKVSKAQVMLRSLESTAQTYRSLYDALLEKMASTAQQTSLPISEARVITQATPPTEKSAPRGLPVLAAGAMLGLALGVGLTIVRRLFVRGFRDAKEVTDATGILCVGVIPHESNLEYARAGAMRPSGSELRFAQFAYALNAPFSRFAEVLRALKFAADRQQPDGQDANIIGVVSALPGEGKTLVASNLASLLHASSGPVLLVDADIRNPTLSRAAASGLKHGLADILSGDATLDEALIMMPKSGLHFISAISSAPIVHSAELLSSASMAKFLREMRDRYRYVILDLPPIVPVVDAIGIAPLLDTMFLVIEWGSTPQTVVQDCIRSTPTMQGVITGAVLNNADPHVLLRQEEAEGRRYGAYYQK